MELWYLITVNSDGSVSYMNKGSYRQMKTLATKSFHRVTSIDDNAKAQRRYGVNR
jgi:hypothetical protein